jgi:hypothetical protein
VGCWDVITRNYFFLNKFTNRTKILNDIPAHPSFLLKTNAGYSRNDNEPGGIENATHNTFPKLT